MRAMRCARLSVARKRDACSLTRVLQWTEPLGVANRREFSPRKQFPQLLTVCAGDPTTPAGTSQADGDPSGRERSQSLLSDDANVHEFQDKGGKTRKKGRQKAGNGTSKARVYGTVRKISRSWRREQESFSNRDPWEDRPPLVVGRPRGLLCRCSTAFSVCKKTREPRLRLFAVASTVWATAGLSSH